MTRDYDENLVVHLNVFSTLARDIIKIAFKEESRSWRYNSEAVIMLPTNEVVYDLNKVYSWYSGLSDAEKAKMKQNIAAKLLKDWTCVFERNVRWLPFSEDRANITNFKKLDDALKNHKFKPEKGRYSSVNRELEKVSLKEVMCLVEMLRGKQLHSLEYEYGKEVVQKLRGTEADPFTMGSVSILMKQIAELGEALDEEKEKIRAELKEREKAAIDEYNVKVKAIKDQIDALRK